MSKREADSNERLARYAVEVRDRAEQAMDAGDLDLAEEELRRAIATIAKVMESWIENKRKVVEAEVMELGAILHEDLAAILYRRGTRLDEALEALDMALRLHQVLGPESEEVARTLSEIAEVYDAMGDPAASREYMRRALAVGGAG